MQASNGSTAVRWDRPRFSDDDKLMSVREISGQCSRDTGGWEEGVFTVFEFYQLRTLIPRIAAKSSAFLVRPNIAGL